MELTDEFTVRASLAEVWAFFWDFQRLAKCIPGCERIESRDDRNYRARLVQRVGPFQVGMDLDLTVQDVAPEQRVLVSGGGKDRMGNRLNITRFLVEVRSAGGVETIVSYTLDFNLYGRLATLGSSVIKRKSEEVKVEFTRCVTQQLEGAG